MIVQQRYQRHFVDYKQSYSSSAATADFRAPLLFSLLLYLVDYCQVLTCSTVFVELMNYIGNYYATLNLSHTHKYSEFLEIIWKSVFMTRIPDIPKDQS